MDYFELSDIFQDGLKAATAYGLQSEYIAAFLSQLGLKKGQVENAVGAALYEWDL